MKKYLRLSSAAVVTDSLRVNWKYFVVTFCSQNYNNQLLQLCTARTVSSILVTVRLYTVMPEVCRWLTNEKQRKTDIPLTDQ